MCTEILFDKQNITQPVTYIAEMYIDCYVMAFYIAFSNKEWV